MKNLDQKIQEIKEGDFLAFTSSVSYSGAGYLVEYVTDKAIKVDGEWIPKSQIIDIDLGVKFRGIISNDDVTECKDIHLSTWFDEKLERSRKKVYGF